MLASFLLGFIFVSSDNWSLSVFSCPFSGADLGAGTSLLLNRAEKFTELQNN